MQARKAPNTIVTYASAWRSFVAWCAAAQLQPLPASTGTVRDFITWCLVEQYRLLTVQTRLAAIAHHHAAAGRPSPCDASIRDYLSCARRELKEVRRGKTAISYELLCRVVQAYGDGPVAVRDRTMIILAFASGWRRGEIVALQYADVRFVAKGLEILQRYSKTDQTGKGRLVGIDKGEHPLTCPVRALHSWLAIRGTWEGPLFPRFTSRHQVTRVGLEPRGQILHRSLKRILERVGEDATKFGAHSLRSGMITASTENGADLPSIMQRTGHRNVETVMRYVRPAQAFRRNPLAGVL